MWLGLVWNLILAFIWCLLTGSVSAASLGAGFIFGYLCLAMSHNHIPTIQGYPSWLLRVLSFFGFIVVELVKSNIAVGKLALSPEIDIGPGIVAVPLSTRNDAVITIMANFITLTPGTISLDVSDDKSTIYIQSVDLDDPEVFIADIKSLEARVVGLLG